MRFLVAIRPGLTSPGLSARMAATFDRLSMGRMLINVVTGGDMDENRGDGLHLGHDERYDLTDEFLSVWRGMSRGEVVDFNGAHLHIKGGRLIFKPIQEPHPPLYFGGSSEAAMRVAARHADVYLTWGEPPADVAVKIEQVKKLAEKTGRRLRFGIRLHVIVRETESEAWADADRLISRLTDDMIAAAQSRMALQDSVGQQRMLQLHGGNRKSLVLSPNLWAGVGLVRGGAGTALVGSADSVAERIREYAALGIDTFIMSGYPHLEEAYRTAELLFDRLPLSPIESCSSQRSEQCGEIIGNDISPAAAAARRST